jgi:hypothetical protein
MVTATLERPAAQPDLSAAVDHLLCCGKEVAVCGADVAGEPPCVADCGHRVCPLCALIEAEDLPCPDPSCSYRDDT